MAEVTAKIISEKAQEAENSANEAAKQVEETKPADESEFEKSLFVGDWFVGGFSKKYSPLRYKVIKSPELNISLDIRTYLVSSTSISG